LIVDVAWPSASAPEMVMQVADKIEKNLQELPYGDGIETPIRVPA
jgi:multidrug efflux pump